MTCNIKFIFASLVSMGFTEALIYNPCKKKKSKKIITILLNCVEKLEKRK